MNRRGESPGWAMLRSRFSITVGGAGAGTLMEWLEGAAPITTDRSHSLPPVLPFVMMKRLSHQGESAAMRFFGKEIQGQMVGAGQFHCSFCKRLSLYALFEVRQRRHLFWIPVTTGPKERVVICGRCQGQLPGEVLQLSDSFPISWPPGSHLQDRPRPRNQGQRVLARWPFEPFWYPATVSERNGERVWVHYDDGHKACLPDEQVAEMNVQVGDAVYARWKCGPLYYPGRITRKLGEEIHIEYDDGDWEETTVSVVRVLPEQYVEDDEDDEGEEWRRGHRLE